MPYAEMRVIEDYEPRLDGNLGYTGEIGEDCKFDMGERDGERSEVPNHI